MSKSGPQITVAIPFFNEERHLSLAVRSILAQTFQSFELLLIDDGSSDRSLAVARSFDDARINVISDGKHRGLAGRLNQIAKMAQAPVIARMDADDVCHPSRLTRQLDAMSAANADVVGSWVGIFEERSKSISVVEAPTPQIRSRADAFQSVVPHATILSRKQWLLENPYDESLGYAEDRDLWCRAAHHARFAMVEEPLYTIRIITDDVAAYPKKYAEAQRWNRILDRRYGPAAVGLVRTAKAWTASYLKSIVVRTAFSLGKSQWVLRTRRGRQPSANERAMIELSMSAAKGADGVAHLFENNRLNH